jgi:hypothetical protein
MMRARRAAAWPSFPRAERSRIEEMTRALCTEHLPADVRPHLKWGRAAYEYGVAEYGLICYRDPRITYSARIFAVITEHDRVETVHHEVAHLVVFYEVAAEVREASRRDEASAPRLWDALEREGCHGPRWRERMRFFGYARPKDCRP